MQKAQISLDLLLALLTAIVLITSFGYVINAERQSHEQLLIRQQLASITENTANILTSTQSISDMEFSIQYKLPKIKYVDENQNNRSDYPTVRILDENKLNAGIMVKGKLIDYNAYFWVPKGIVIIPDNVYTTGILGVSKSA
jgi:uncharacterized protein (UPF0333 family)